MLFLGQCGFNSPDQGVDLRRLDIIQLLDGILDLPLVGLEVNNEHQGVVVLDLLHGRLGVERVLDRAELVHPREVGDGLAGVFRVTGETECRGSVEGDGSADFAGRVRGSALEGGLFGGFGFGILGLGRGWMSVGAGHLDIMSDKREVCRNLGD